MASAADLSGLLDVIQSIPPDQNPYTFMAVWAYRQIDPAPGPGFKRSLYVNFVLYSINVILAIITLVGKVYQRKMWLFRTRSTPNGTVILPNTTILFTGWALTYCTIAIVHAHFVFTTYYDEHGGQALIASEGPLWLPLYAAFWFENWGMSASAYLQYQLHTSNSFHMPAWVVNGFFIGVFVLYAATTLPIFAHATSLLSTVNQALSTLRHNLVTSGAHWQPGQNLSLTSDDLNQLNIMSTQSGVFANYMAVGYWLFAGFVLISIGTFLPIAWWQIKILKAHVENQTSYHLTADTTLKRTVTMLTLEVLAVTLACTLYTFTSGWVASDFLGVTTSPHNLPIAYSLALYVYGLIGVPVHALIAWRVWLPTFRRKLHRASTISGKSINVQFPGLTANPNIQVTTKTVTHVEELEMPHWEVTSRDITSNEKRVLDSINEEGSRDSRVYNSA